MTRFYVGLLAVIAITATALGIQAAFDAEKQSEPPHQARPVAATGPLPLTVAGASHPGEVIAQLATWFAGVERAEAERLAAEGAARVEAARAASERRVAPQGSGATHEGVGDCTGFAIPDHIIERESGGNPWAVNSSSGAFGCAQVMPFHWAPGGACAGLDRYSIDDQRTCVDWLSQGGTRLSPWAATR